MLSPPDDEALVAHLQTLALEAGRVIMRIREAGFAVEAKADASPVTVADRQAETLILKGLNEAYGNVPIVAEEEVAAGRAPDDLGDEFFLVDALDGTREFVKRGDDFTVNIALVRQSRPSVGVVYAPARNRLFSGRPGRAEATVTEGDHSASEAIRIAIAKAPQKARIVASRSHRTVETDAFIARFPDAETVAVGSSLKFCLLAEGRADIYPRYGRTMEWDIAAGDAVLRAAGGMTVTPDGAPLAYGKRDQANDADFANPWFIAFGDVRPEWPALTQVRGATAD